MLVPLLTVLAVSLISSPNALASVAPAAPAAPASAALRGPPLLCHPIAIGEARSLPWKSGAFGIDKDYDVARVVADTEHLLDGTADALVHMETLRRAVIYLAGEPHGEGGAARTQDITRLLERLQARALEEDSRPPSTPATPPAPATAGKSGVHFAPPAAGPRGHAPGMQLLAPLSLFAAAALAPAPGGGMCARQASGCDAGLCWLDVGYARAAFAQVGVNCGALAPMAATTLNAKQAPAKDKEPSAASEAAVVRAALDKAAALRPKDGAVQLGVALALFDGEVRDEQASMAHLDSALALADDSQSLLRSNLLGTMGKFLGARTHEDLAAAVRERRTRG